MTESTTVASHVSDVLIDLYESLDPVGRALFIEVFTEDDNTREEPKNGG